VTINATPTPEATARPLLNLIPISSRLIGGHATREIARMRGGIPTGASMADPAPAGRGIDGLAADDPHPSGA
jgi:hypothetical protein